jgi:site-specific recombinase XerD
MGKDSQLSLSSLVQGFIFSLEAEGKAPLTVHYYQGNLQRFLWYANEHDWPSDPSTIDAWKIREFLVYASTARNRWGTTGNGSENCREPSKTGGWRYYRTLRAFFNWAISEGLLRENPLSNIKIKPPKEQPVEPYTRDELRRFIAVSDRDFANGDKFLGSRAKAIVLLFIDTGLRLSELANLKLTQVDLQRGRIIVLGKGGWERAVAFNSGAKKALWRYLAFREERAKPSRTADDWLWLTEEGTRLTVAGLYVAFRRIKRRAGVNSRGAVHKLRHTFAINALRGLKDPFLLQLLLGHKSLEMTRRYTQALKIEEALEAISKASPVDILHLN